MRLHPAVQRQNCWAKKSGDSIFTLDNGINRLALPEEIGIYAKFLVSDAGNMLVGETIHISAGRGLFDVR